MNLPNQHRFRTGHTTHSSQCRIQFGLLDELSPCEYKSQKNVQGPCCSPSENRQDLTQGEVRTKSDNESVVKWRSVQKSEKDRRAYGAPEKVRLKTLHPQMVLSELDADLHRALLTNTKLSSGFYFSLKNSQNIFKGREKGRKSHKPSCLYYLFSLLFPRVRSKAAWRGREGNTQRLSPNIPQPFSSHLNHTPNLLTLALSIDGVRVCFMS